MTDIAQRHILVAGLLLALAACAEAPEAYSPDYSYVPTGETGKLGGKALVPDACLAEVSDTEPPAATHMTFVPEVGPHLPAGCANAFNLQRMVERQNELVRGRRMGDAAAAPSARAAQRYLYGEEAPLGAANTATNTGTGTSGGPSMGGGT